MVLSAPEGALFGGGLLAFASWLAGDGALACCALDRCFGADPEDQLAQHVLFLLESGCNVISALPYCNLRAWRGDGESDSGLCQVSEL